MAEVRLRYGALFTSRWIRASAMVSVSLAIGSAQPPLEAAGKRRGPAAEAADDPELRARWRALPRSIRPHDWVTETGATNVPGSLLIAEERRPPEGYYPAYG